MTPNPASIAVLRHATPARNRGGIDSRGLLAKLSQGKAKRVWLHAATETLWALQHVGKRHTVSPADCIVYTVRVDPTRLRRGPRKGLYWIAGDVPPQDLTQVRTAQECLISPEGP